MTKREAEALIQRVCRNELPLGFTQHFWTRANQRLAGLNRLHVFEILRSGKISHGPTWNPTHANHNLVMAKRLPDFGEVRLVLSIAEHCGAFCITVYGTDEGD